MRIYKSFFRFEKCRKACKYRLYRLMRTYKEIVKNYILIYEKSKNIYTIGPVLSSRTKTKFEHFSYPNFYIKDKNCERDFHVGDFIKIVYPCSQKLNVRTERQLYAIYAFSSAEAYSINTQKGMDK